MGHVLLWVSLLQNYTGINEAKNQLKVDFNYSNIDSL